jgi:hypothetical protein
MHILKLINILHSHYTYVLRSLYGIFYIDFMYVNINKLLLCMTLSLPLYDTVSMTQYFYLPLGAHTIL